MLKCLLKNTMQKPWAIGWNSPEYYQCVIMVFGCKMSSHGKSATTNGHANIASTPSQKPKPTSGHHLVKVSNVHWIFHLRFAQSRRFAHFFLFFRLFCVISSAFLLLNSLNVPWLFKIQWRTSQPLLNRLHPSKMVKFDTGPWQSFYNVRFEWDQVRFVKKYITNKPVDMTNATYEEQFNKPYIRQRLSQTHSKECNVILDFLFLRMFLVYSGFSRVSVVFLYFPFIFLHCLVSFQRLLRFCGFFLAIRHVFRYIPCSCFANFTCFDKLFVTYWLLSFR